jgi:LysR family hydrogen peroxide-inducible transcriptional activator
VEIDQLRYFLKVAEMQNFTRAAEELLISQSALSRSITNLEKELGQTILERQTRQVVLTEGGKLLKIKAEQIVKLVQETTAEMTDDGQRGSVRVGTIPTIAPYFLPGCLKGFAETFPMAKIKVHEETTGKLLDRCHQGQIDVAILALPVTSQHLEVTPLFDEELLLVLPVGHPLEHKKKLTIAELKMNPFVLLDEAHCLSDNILALCRQKSFQPLTMEHTSQLATVQELVALGHGISMIPAMARRCDHSQQRVYRSLASPAPTRTIVMVTNPYRFSSKLMHSFQQHVIAYSQTCPDLVSKIE